MAFIGSLITTVKANTNPLKKNLKSARKTVAKFAQSIKGVAVGAAKFGSILGGVVTAAIVAYTVKSLSAIDATAKLGRELGITTEALIGYQLAAGLSGVSSEVLNKAISKMARTVGEARSGITTGTKALEDFGIEIEDLQGLTTQQVFEKFADEIARIPDPMERAAKASLIFGRAGGKLLNFLSLGSEGLAEVKEEANALGISFNEIDAAKVEAANDAMLKMSTVAQGLGNTIAIKVAPFITLATDKMTDFIKESGGINTIVTKSIKQMTKFLGQFIDTLNFGKSAWKTFSGTARHGLGVVAEGLGRIAKKGKTSNFLLGLSDELHSMADEDLASAKDAFEKFKKGVASSDIVNYGNNIQRGATNAAQSLEDVAEKQQKLNEKIREQEELHAKNIAAQKEQEEQYKKVIDSASKIFEETRTPLEKVEAEIKSVVDLMNSAKFDEKLSEGLHRKIVELQKAKQELLLGGEIEAAKTDKSAVDELANRFKTPMQKILEEEAKIQDLKAKGRFEGREDVFQSAMEDIITRAEAIEAQSMKEKDLRKKKEDEIGTFKELDLKNIDVAGLTGKENIEKKQLTENEKQTKLLKQIAEKGDQKVPVAV